MDCFASVNVFHFGMFSGTLLPSKTMFLSACNQLKEIFEYSSWGNTANLDAKQ
jgi:hypothetical protein